ncbi:MAG: hypothetical protein AAF639_31135 [Chloroflexota bacterium]
MEMKLSLIIKLNGWRQKSGQLSHPNGSYLDENEQWRQQMLVIHQTNLQQLQAELATYPVGEKPLHLMNQVAAEEEAVRQYGG